VQQPSMEDHLRLFRGGRGNAVRRLKRTWSRPPMRWWSKHKHGAVWPTNTTPHKSAEKWQSAVTALQFATVFRIRTRVATITDLGLTRKQVHEARIVRDAEKAKPGISLPSKKRNS
jgi:hypothetical protein